MAVDPTTGRYFQSDDDKAAEAARQIDSRATFGGVAAGTDPATGQPIQSSAQLAAQGYGQKANDMANRQGVQLNYGQANATYGQANQSLDAANANRAQADQARGAQQNALALQQSAAEGNQPSQAAILGQNMINQSLQSQLAGAASARGGPLAQMAAQRNVQQGAAAFQQQGANNIAAMRANEMANARDAYMQGASGIRGQDYAGAQQATGMAGTQGQMAAQQAQMAQAQGQMDMGQRQLNQQGQQFYDQMGWNTQNAQADRGAQQNQQAEEHWAKQANMNQQSRQTAADRIMKGVGAVAGGVGDTIAGIFKAKGGPVGCGHPYIVGEKGPELVVPRALGGLIKAGGADDDDTGLVDLGGSSGISGDMVQKASTGRTGLSMMPVGGGGVVGGGVSKRTMGPMGYGVPRAKGGPVQAGGAPSQADVEFIKYGPPADASALDDRLSQQPILLDTARPKGTPPDWLSRVMEPEVAQKGVADSNDRGRYDARGEDEGDWLGGSTKPAEKKGAGAIAGSGLSKFGSLMARAGGGPVDGRQPYLVGEKGPELIVPKHDGVVIPAGQTAAILSDERAKQEAFSQGLEKGAAHATEYLTGETMQPWSQDDKPKEEADDDYIAPPGPSPLPPPPEVPNEWGEEVGPAALHTFTRGDDKRGYRLMPDPNRHMQSFTRDNPVAEANRSMAGSAYAYKPGMTPPDQKPGELNYGPMAQNLEKSPVAATAVKTDPASGLKTLDRDKLLKVVASGVADLQHQQDATRASMQRASMSGGRRRQ